MSKYDEQEKNEAYKKSPEYAKLLAQKKEESA